MTSTTPATTPDTSAPDDTTTWVFTFGSGQQYDGRYVAIPGTYGGARDEMLRHFGQAWSFQYPSAEAAGVDRHGLVELPRTEWPEPATTPTATEPDDATTHLPELTRPLAYTGWVLDAVTPMAGAATRYSYLHPVGGEVVATVERGDPDDVVELRITDLDMEQAVGAVRGAGLTGAQPPTNLLDAVRAVIDAGQLEWGTGVDVDRVQGLAHSRLIAAYQAATGAAEPAESDHWTDMAADLRQITDRIASLAGTPVPPDFGAHVSIYSNYTAADADRSVPVVDAIAEALGIAATTETEGRGLSRQTKRVVKGFRGQVYVWAMAMMPNPPTRAEKLRSRAELAEQNAALQAELAELRAQAAGGAR